MCWEENEIDCYESAAKADVDSNLFGAVPFRWSDFNWAIRGVSACTIFGCLRIDRMGYSV